MTTRYQSKHYEDVARLLNKQPVASVGSLYQAVKRMGEDFADLFAADNPRICNICRAPKGETALCFGSVLGRASNPPGEHNFQGGFDRTQFLAACGLESEG